MPIDYSPDLYAVIWHRNHLGVISANSLSFSNSTFYYDFSTGLDQVYGGSAGYKQIGVSTWGMISGDANSDGEVSNIDVNDYWLPEAGLSGYLRADFNLNVETDNIDKNDLWIINAGKGSQVIDE